MFRLQFLRFLTNTPPHLITNLQKAPGAAIINTWCSMSTVRKQKISDQNNLTSKSPRSKQLTENKFPETEQEFLVRLKNDPDSFGAPLEPEPYDADDLKEEKFLEDRPLPTQRLSTKQYADIIKTFIRKRQIKEAIDVLEVRMIEQDRVKPENYIYNLILGACGRVGYTKKAFSLYNKMKGRGLNVTGGTYTALFNACANSPWPEDGLSRARHLREIMLEKMYEPNLTNYNAMIKAFGRCGDLQTAFSIVDEMATRKFQIKDDTLNFLLQACISDKEAGFRHALLVWRKFIHKNIKPSIHTFNLVLRAVRDCGIGDVEVTKEVLDRILKNDTKLLENKVKLLSEPTSSVKDNLENEPKHDLVIQEELRPNLMAKIPHLGSVISIEEIKKPEDRLILIGGFKGFLKTMEEYQCVPDIKTITVLLDSLPGNDIAEKELISCMRKLKIKPDVDFFNMLIKKRSIRFDYQGAKDILYDMTDYKLRPNLITYGVLALGCKNKKEALDLIAEMKEHVYTLNTEILGAMLRQACCHQNFAYVLEMMETTLREQIKPNKIFMECLENFKKQCKEISNDPENKLGQKKSFQSGYKVFQLRYKSWLQEVQVDESENEHPWTQFRQTSDPNVSKYFKDKSIRFKAQHTSLFKVKTSPKYKKYND